MSVETRKICITIPEVRRGIRERGRFVNKIWKTGIQDGYIWFDTVKKCYTSLVDEKSKKIFCSRLMVDLAVTAEHMQGLLHSSHFDELENKICEIKQKNAPVYLYGAKKEGASWIQLLGCSGVDIVAFIDRNYKAIKEHCGKPVIAPPKTPDELPQNAVIFITTMIYQEEIHKYLIGIGIPDSSIAFLKLSDGVGSQYFDFMDHYIGKGAFIDAGCLNGDTSALFVKYSKGNYTKIIAFEPDEVSFKQCLARAGTGEIKNMEVIQAGLGKETGVARFYETHSGNSAVSESGDAEIQIVALDEVVKEEPVAFIKMDIEGSELAALQGAANTICRNKPLCAICAYHKPGDVLVIMEYLKQLVPEYRFAIRHYSSFTYETVLYAFL